MKKTIFLSILGLVPMVASAATTPWWERPTICRLNTTDCYSNLSSAGFESGMWDTNGKCWGMKLICPEALTSSNERYPVPMPKDVIAKGTGINKDFDLDVLNNDCFGARKTADNGTKAYVDGKLVNVWCNGILMNPDENLANGEITYSVQPTCEDLAFDGYVAVLDKRCYGKFYDPSKYFIECTGSAMLPSKIVEVNDADYMGPTGAMNPKDKDEATALFNKMYNNSKTQHAKYFK